MDYGSPNAPSCYGGGFTGETNNLIFANAPIAERRTSPAIVFTESSAGTSSACASATSVASGELTDTHDLNGDGKSDILWLNTNGTVTIWEMNGGQVLATVGGQVVSNAWTIVGTGDFNGDGKSDILWRNTNGTVAIWEMNGGQLLASVGGQVVSAFLWTLVQ